MEFFREKYNFELYFCSETGLSEASYESDKILDPAFYGLDQFWHLSVQKSSTEILKTLESKLFLEMI